MNNPFHRAAIKAFEDVYIAMVETVSIEQRDRIDHREFKREFERKLEAQARAFDACKAGSEISMATLSHEMLKAFYLAKARLKIDGNWSAAERAFFDHMKPHLEIRLW